MFYGEQAIAHPKHNFQNCFSPEVIASTTILRSVLENQPHSEDSNWPPLHKEKHEIRLPWSRELGQRQQVPLAIYLKSEFPSLR